MKHTLYFDGNVQSIRYRQANGDVSVGVMAPGNYRFSSDLAETVAILEGTLMFSLDTDTQRDPYARVNRTTFQQEPLSRSLAMNMSAISAISWRRHK